MCVGVCQERCPRWGGSSLKSLPPPRLFCKGVNGASEEQVRSAGVIESKAATPASHLWWAEGGHIVGKTLKVAKLGTG